MDQPHVGGLGSVEVTTPRTDPRWTPRPEQPGVAGQRPPNRISPVGRGGQRINVASGGKTT